MEDYFVHDQGWGDGALIPASNPTDAAQGFIDTAHRTFPGRIVNPHLLNIYPVARKNRLVTPIDTDEL